MKPGAEPPAINSSKGNPDPFNDLDGPVMRAAAKVAAIHERCVSMWDKDTPRDPSFAQAHEESRIALIDLISIPCKGVEGYSTKLDTLNKMVLWIGHEDPELFECVLKLAHEAQSLLSDRAAGRPNRGAPWPVRWLFGIVIPGLLLGRWDSGGLG